MTSNQKKKKKIEENKNIRKWKEQKNYLSSIENMKFISSKL